MLTLLLAFLDFAAQLPDEEMKEGTGGSGG